MRFMINIIKAIKHSIRNSPHVPEETNYMKTEVLFTHVCSRLDNLLSYPSEGMRLKSDPVVKNALENLYFIDYILLSARYKNKLNRVEIIYLCHQGMFNYKGTINILIQDKELIGKLNGEDIYRLAVEYRHFCKHLINDHLHELKSFWNHPEVDLYLKSLKEQHLIIPKAQQIPAENDSALLPEVVSISDETFNQDIIIAARQKAKIKNINVNATVSISIAAGIQTHEEALQLDCANKKINSSLRRKLESLNPPSSTALIFKLSPNFYVETYTPNSDNVIQDLNYNRGHSTSLFVNIIPKQQGAEKAELIEYANLAENNEDILKLKYSVPMP